MSQTVKIAAAQLAPAYLDRAKTVDIACQAMEEAAANGAELIVFPEVFISGYPDWVWLVPNSQGTLLNKLYQRLHENAVSVPDETTLHLCESASKAGINVVMGMHEINREGSGSSLYNSLLFIDKTGNILGTHRKLIPTGGERLVWSRGDGSTLRVYDTSAGRLGGLICWENLMPLARTALYEQGVQILASPTWDKSGNWLNTMRSNAREGGMFVVSVCMALRVEDIPDELEFKSLYPEGREWVNTGNSCIVGPDGKVLAGPMEAETGILYADIDPAAILSAKRMFDVSGHYARPDVFRFMVKTARNP